MLFIMGYDLLRRLAEDKDVVLSDKLRNLHVGSVHGADRDCPVQHQLHIAGAACLF